MMKAYTTKWVLLAVIFCAGCKLQIPVDSGGRVLSESGRYDCELEDSALIPLWVLPDTRLCEVDISDIYFDELFTAEPSPDFVFTGWKYGTGYFCAGSTEPCQLNTAGFESNEALTSVLESDDHYYLEPIFEHNTLASYFPFEESLDNYIVEDEMAAISNFEYVEGSYGKAVRIRGDMVVPNPLRLKHVQSLNGFGASFWFNLPSIPDRGFFKRNLFEYVLGAPNLRYVISIASHIDVNTGEKSLALTALREQVVPRFPSNPVKVSLIDIPIEEGVWYFFSVSQSWDLRTTSRYFIAKEDEVSYVELSQILGGGRLDDDPGALTFRASPDSELVIDELRFHRRGLTRVEMEALYSLKGERPPTDG